MSAKDLPRAIYTICENVLVLSGPAPLPALAVATLSRICRRPVTSLWPLEPEHRQRRAIIVLGYEGHLDNVTLSDGEKVTKDLKLRIRDDRAPIRTGSKWPHSRHPVDMRSRPF
jgi:hypothetical protein